MDLDRAQAVPELLAEGAGAHAGPQVGGGACDEAHVDGVRGGVGAGGVAGAGRAAWGGVASAEHLAAREEAEERVLRGERQGLDGVQEERAAVGEVHEALARGGALGARGAEEADALGVVGERGAREAHEGARAPPAAVVDEARDAVAAGAFLALDEDGGAGAGGLRRQAEGRPRLRGDARELAERSVLGALGELAALARQTPLLDRPRGRQRAQRERLDRLREHVGPERPRCLDGGLHAARPGKEHERDRRVLARDGLRGLQVAGVHEGHVGRLRAQQREARRPVLRGERLEIVLREGSREAAAHRRVRVDHEGARAAAGGASVPGEPRVPSPLAASRRGERALIGRLCGPRARGQRSPRRWRAAR